MSIRCLQVLFVPLFLLLTACELASTRFLWESQLTHLLTYSDTTTFYLFTLKEPFPLVPDTFPGFFSLSDSVGFWVQFQMEKVKCEVLCFSQGKGKDNREVPGVETKERIEGITVKFVFPSYREAISGYQLCMKALWQRWGKAPQGHFGHHVWLLDDKVIHLYLFDLRPMVVISFAIR